MKVEYVLPERERKEIEKLQKHIEEIKQSYIDEYEKRPFQWQELDKQIRNDLRIQALEKTIDKLYVTSVGKYIITAESEEDKEKIDKWKNETDKSRQFYIDELRRPFKSDYPERPYKHIQRTAGDEE